MLHDCVFFPFTDPLTVIRDGDPRHDSQCGTHALVPTPTITRTPTITLTPTVTPTPTVTSTPTRTPRPRATPRPTRTPTTTATSTSTTVGPDTEPTATPTATAPVSGQADLAAPALTATASGTNTIELGWNAVAGAASYELQLWNGSAWDPLVSGLTGTTYTHGNLAAPQDLLLPGARGGRQWRRRAYGRSGCRRW